MTRPAWYQEALKAEGIKEIKGPKHNPEVVQMFAESGHPWVADDETAWCAAFANAMLVRAGHKGTQSLAARSFTNYGHRCEIKEGAIGVFSRGSSSWMGHVGFLTGRTKPGYIEVLGGNQRNKVGRNWYSNKRLLAVRWPPTMRRSKTVKASIASGTVAVATEAATHIKPIADQFDSIETLRYVGIACALILAASIIYFRYVDMKEKDR